MSEPDSDPSVPPERDASGEQAAPVQGRVADWFALTPLFGGLDPALLAALSEASKPMRLDTGAMLFRAGDPADAIYVVAEGELLAQGLTAGTTQPTARLRTGDTVGEGVVLSRRPRSATVSAVEPTQVLRLPVDALERILATDPAARAQVVAHAVQRLPSTRLGSLPLFAGVPPARLERLDTDVAHVPVRAGEVLVKQGERADAMFVVLQGTFEATVTTGSHARIVGTMTRGDSIGELAMLTGEPRAATVRAVRDGIVVRVAHDDVERLMNEYASVGAAMARALAHRLRASNRPRPAARRVQCIAVVQQSEHRYNIVPELAAILRRDDQPVVALSAEASRAMGGDIDDETSVASQQLEAWLTSLEATHRFVLLSGGPQDDAWTRLAMRRADLILIIADGVGNAAPCAAEVWHAARGAAADAQRVELVLRRAGERPPSETERWYSGRRIDAHHHLRTGAAGAHPGDLARLGRFLRGEAIGVALSGGGARGFAHIGVLRALDEVGIPIDVVVGTSMGAVVGAQYALGWDYDRMIAANLAAFPEADVIRDFTVPIVALMKGRSTVKMFETMYGHARLEDCRIRCRLVSTSLTRSDIVVHERGPIWLWARASTSVPGIGPPVVVGGELLVDGGVVDDLPVGPLQAAGANTLIALDVTSHSAMTTTLGDHPWVSGWSMLWHSLLGRGESATLPNLLQILTRTSTMASAHRAVGVGDLVDLHLRPPAENVPTMAWRSAADAAALGYKYALPVVTAWAASRPGMLAPR